MGLDRPVILGPLCGAQPSHIRTSESVFMPVKQGRIYNLIVALFSNILSHFVAIHYIIAFFFLFFFFVFFFVFFFFFFFFLCSYDSSRRFVTFLRHPSIHRATIFHGFLFLLYLTHLLVMSINTMSTDVEQRQ